MSSASTRRSGHRPPHAAVPASGVRVGAWLVGLPGVLSSVGCDVGEGSAHHGVALQALAVVDAGATQPAQLVRRAVQVWCTSQTVRTGTRPAPGSKGASRWVKGSRPETTSEPQSSPARGSARRSSSSGVTVGTVLAACGRRARAAAHARRQMRALRGTCRPARLGRTAYQSGMKVESSMGSSSTSSTNS